MWIAFKVDQFSLTKPFTIAVLHTVSISLFIASFGGFDCSILDLRLF